MDGFIIKVKFLILENFKGKFLFALLEKFIVI